MKRTLAIVAGLAVLALVVVVFWASQGPSASTGLSRPSLLKSAMTNSMELVRKEFTGGVGVMLREETGAGLVKIQGVGVGSPGEQAGLRVNDIITSVDGWPTAGKPLTQITERIRGYTAN